MQKEKDTVLNALFNALLSIFFLIVFAIILYQAIFLDQITIQTKGNLYHIVYEKEPKLFLFTSLFSAVFMIYSSYTFFFYTKLAYAYREEKHTTVFYTILFLLIVSSIFYFLSKILTAT